MAIVQGQDLMAFIADNDKGQLYSIGGATSHTLNLQQNLQSISTKDVGSGRWSMSQLGLLDWSVSSENYTTDNTTNDTGVDALDDSRYGYGFNDLFNFMVARKPIYLAFGLEGSSENYNEGKLLHPDSSLGWKPSNAYYAGWAFVSSLTQNAPCGELSSYSVEFQGHGPLTLVTKEGGKVGYSAGNETVIPVATTVKTAAKTESK